MGKIVFLFLFILTINSMFAQDGFKGYKWGTSKEVIESKEGLPPYSHGQIKSDVWYSDSLFNREVKVKYRYNDGSLYMGVYEYLTYLTGDALDFIRRAEVVLSEKYGYSDKNSNLLNDADLLNLMNKGESYTIMFNGGVEIKFFNTKLYHPRKTECVAIVYSSPNDYTYTKEDSDKL